MMPKEQGLYKEKMLRCALHSAQLLYLRVIISTISLVRLPILNLFIRILQLHMKIKGLLSELDEIRAQRETSGLQSDHVSEMQS